ncbi:hypothetical protein L207DRAFT_575212 [Hyaloscypha variabilis F]|uniref:Uncharacterized protein n=1 Tax=Hyaloscypha variabilis (strain UAMH 11265 / GT02V1 / F) TaxID=1149755 RepID=A0A2J6SCQ8_HYAVF|nr:hypothetical protein L207DRAFT_575212 [Hyaloscypha variabilis F]
MPVLSVNHLPVSSNSLFLQKPFTILPVQHISPRTYSPRTPQTSFMSAPIQDRSITIFHKGKPITWRPRDQILPPTSIPTSPPTYTLSPSPTTSASAVEAQPEVVSSEGKKTGRTTKLKARFKKGFEKLFPQMTKQKQATKVFNTGIDTFSSGKHSFVDRLKVWKLGHNGRFDSPCEGCHSKNARLDSDDPISSHSTEDLIMNHLQAPSVNEERVNNERLERMMVPSEMSIQRSAPIPIPGAKRSFRACCPRRGKENQKDGNVGIHVKDVAINTSTMPDDMIHVGIQESPVVSPRHFATSDESLPEDGQPRSPVRECFSIDEETMSDLELSPVGLGCTGLSPDLVQVPRDVESPVCFEIRCPPGVDLETGLREAMESSLPHIEVEPDDSNSPNAPVLDTAEHEADKTHSSNAPALNAADDDDHKVDAPEISLAESFTRTRSSLSSADGHSAPSHSFLIEGPFSRLGSDFVDVEDYLQNPSSPPKYPALDSSATTEDFGFRQQQENPFHRLIRLLGSDSEDPPSVELSQKEVLETWEQSTGLGPDAKYYFSRYRPIPGSIQDGALLRPLSPPSTCSSPTHSPHLRGGGDESRFSLFRSVGKGKLVGNVERGKALLNEQVSGTYMIGAWGRNETWREFGVKMEKRVAKRKQLAELDEAIEKLKAEKASAGGKGFFGEAVANVKDWFVLGKGAEEAEELDVTVTEQRTRIAG